MAADLPGVEFAFPGPLRDRLVAAILSGEKTATSGLAAGWEHDGDPLPRVGERNLVVDSDGRGVAVIEVVEVAVIRLGDADDRLARDEGEGFSGVAEWRAAHERFWLEEQLPAMGRQDLRLDDDTPIVVERFRLVERLSATG